MNKKEISKILLSGANQRLNLIAWNRSKTKATEIEASYIKHNATGLERCTDFEVLMFIKKNECIINKVLKKELKEKLLNNL